MFLLQALEDVLKSTSAPNGGAETFQEGRIKSLRVLGRVKPSMDETADAEGEADNTFGIQLREHGHESVRVR